VIDFLSESGFDLPRHTWSLLTCFWTRVSQICTDGALPYQLFVNMDNSRWWTT